MQFSWQNFQLQITAVIRSAEWVSDDNDNNDDDDFDDTDDNGFLLQTFSPLVDKHGLSDEDQPVPVEFVGDHER